MIQSRSAISSQEDREQVKQTLANLKDFLKYLQEKGIISFPDLQNNKKELENLVNDLLKLDLQKFSAANKLTTD